MNLLAHSLISAKEVWIALSPVSTSTTEPCQNEGCNGMLRWNGGILFTFEPWMTSIDYYKNNSTMIYNIVLNNRGEMISRDIEQSRGGLCQCEKSKLNELTESL